MNELNTAILSTLSGDSTLTGYLGGTAIYHMQAPEKQPYPYVVFSWQGGGTTNEVNHIRNSIHFIRAYHTNENAAGLIDARIHALLHNTAFSVSGWTTVTTHREDDYETVEIAPDKSYVFCIGGIYRFILDK